MKKIIYSIFIISILLSYTSVFAYEYVDENNMSGVKDIKSEIYDRVDMYEDLAGEKEEEEDELDYTNASSDKMWWPIGSKETTTIDGKVFAKGNPVAIGLTSGYGAQESFRIKEHGGVDLNPGTSNLGETNIIAAKDGIVVYSSKNISQCPTGFYGSTCGGGWGNYVKIKHSDGYYTLYAHMEQNTVTVKVGEAVKQGQVIGKVGSSGSSTGPHLHFEVRDPSDQRVNPMDYIDLKNPRPTTSVVVGDSNKQTVCLTLKQENYNETAIAAIMKNIDSESRFDNLAENEIGAYGIAQWYDVRRTRLENKYPNSYTELESQIQYLIYELKTDYQYVNKKLLSTKYTVEDKVYYYCMNYERPGEDYCASRKSEASTFVSYVQNGCK